MIVVHPKALEEGLDLYVQLPNGKFTPMETTRVVTDCRMGEREVYYSQYSELQWYEHNCDKYNPCDMRLWEAWQRVIYRDRPGDETSWMGRLRQFWRDYWIRSN